MEDREYSQICFKFSSEIISFKEKRLIMKISQVVMTKL